MHAPKTLVRADPPSPAAAAAEGDDAGRERNYLLRMFDRSYTVVVAHVSAFVLAALEIQPDGWILSLLLVLLFVLWVASSGYVKRLLDRGFPRAKWARVVSGLVDFVTLVGVFLVTQFTLLRLFQSLDGAEFSLAEAFVGVLLVVVFIVSILQALRTPASDAK